MEKNFQLSQRSWSELFVTLVWIVLPHLLRLPLWVSVMFGISLSWRYLSVQKGWLLPPRYLRNMLAILSIVLIYITFQRVSGKEAGVAFLVSLIGLKLLEMKSLREALLLVFLSYFLMLTHFLYSQTMLTVLYLMSAAILSTATLIGFQTSQFSQRDAFKLAIKLLMQAIPLSIVLFIFFPRVQGPFWGLPPDAFNTSATGLNDKLELGNIANLSSLDNVAFRVTFEGKTPSSNQRYWRGIVFWNTDGRTWRGSMGDGTPTKVGREWRGAPTDYTITLEPHPQPWLFSLDLPVSTPMSGAEHLKPFLLADYQLQTRSKIGQSVIYQMRSYPDARIGLETSIQLERHLKSALQLPPNKHPKTRALAQQWVDENPDPKALIDRAMAYFNQEEFFYTLAPPPLINDPIDEFLFDTRAGFCEHYATAFATLMRAAQIPSRVVVGYQGGTYNPLGGYWVIRQRDAHAWVEVWLKEDGWVRLDPTAAVAPNRIQDGVPESLPAFFEPLGFNRESFAADLFQQFRLRWDMLNSQWNHWVIGYNQVQQQQLLVWLGLEKYGYQALTWLLMGFGGLCVAAVMSWLWWHRPIRHYDNILNIYNILCAKLARRYGIVRFPHEGAQDFAQRVKATFPQVTEDFFVLTNYYIQLRYFNSQPIEIKEFSKQVRRCKL
jgi:protein-glutamine gamma-glutamyltransferase